MLQYRIIPVTPFEQNCTLMWCDETNDAAFVDPGGDMVVLEAALAQHKLTLKKLFLTHGHLDHVGATPKLANKYHIPIEGPEKEDKFWLDRLPQDCERMGLPHCDAFVPQRWLHDGDTISIGKVSLSVHHVPGHTPGHVAFYYAPKKLAWVGDVLFNGSVGRTDFPRGHFPTLVHSITQKLWPLGNDVQFVPGHGPMSTFGFERQTNPYVSDVQLANNEPVDDEH
jgi:hydroxyacylglutathione hydrolase